MQKPSFFDYFQARLYVQAAQSDSDYVLIDGVLKKGTWKTMPNHIHIFLVDGKIEAGPVETIGKKPDELDWDSVHEDNKNANPNPNPVREAVTEKYRNEMMQLSSIKRKDARQSAAEKVLTKMAAEDDFHVIFLNTDGKPSPALHALTQAFADYGKFPIHGSYHDQVAFYNDRVALLTEMAKALPKDSRKDIKVQIDHVTDLAQSLLEHGPDHHEDSKTQAIAPYEDSDNYVTELDEPEIAVHEPGALTNVTPAPHKNTTKQQQHNAPGNGGGAATPPPPPPKGPASAPQSGPSNRPQQSRPGPNPQRGPASRPSTTPNRPQQRPGQSSVRPQTPTTPVPPQKSPRAKSRIMLSIESLLRGIFGFIVSIIAQWVAKGLSNANSDDNKMLYKVTKYVLSNTNVNERDNFFDVFCKTFGSA
jgi:hypothetical protein